MLSQIDNHGKTNYTIIMTKEDGWYHFHLYNNYEDNDDIVVGTTIIKEGNLIINSDLPNALIVTGKEKVVGLEELQPYHIVVNGNYIIYYND